MTPAGYTEDALVEQPAIALMAKLGWETVDAYHEFDHGTMGRESRAEVILTDRLRPALEKLNPDAPTANREIYHLLKNGVRVRVTDPDGDGETVLAVRLVDWEIPSNNDFLLCSQFWVTGEMHTRRLMDLFEESARPSVRWSSGFSRKTPPSAASATCYCRGSSPARWTCRDWTSPFPRRPTHDD